MIDSERFLLESSDRSPHLGETRDTVLETKHADLDTLDALDTLDTRLVDDPVDLLLVSLVLHSTKSQVCSNASLKIPQNRGLSED